MSTTTKSPIESARRIKAALAVLPELRLKLSALPSAARAAIESSCGEIPKSIMGLSDLEAIEKIQLQIAEQTKPAAPAAKPAEPAKVSGAAVLEAATNPATNGPAIEGLKQSLAARLGIEPAGPRCTLEEFRTLTPSQQGKFFKIGGKLYTPEPPAVPPLAPGAKVATLAQFHTIPHMERAAFFKNGGKLKD